MFDQQPGIFFRLFHFDQGEFPFQFPAFQDKFQRSGSEFFQQLFFIIQLTFFQRFVSTVVPDFHLACTIIAFRYMAFKIFVVIRVILHHHGQAFIIGVQRRTFGYSPALEYPIHLQPEIVVQAAGSMSLNNKDQLAFTAFAAAFRLCSLLKFSFLIIVFQCFHEVVVLRLRDCRLAFNCAIRSTTLPLSGAAVFFAFTVLPFAFWLMILSKALA
ncbi:hypothetical protein D3C72_1704370 [compost metagenome]